VQSQDSLLWYFCLRSLRSREELPSRRCSLFAGSLSKNVFDASCPVLHSDLFPEFPCDSELIRVEALSTKGDRVLWCSGCGTEFTYTPNCTWISVVYPGMRSDLEM
jgi:hypothetical protein